jgi:hypothetical protein
MDDEVQFAGRLWRRHDFMGRGKLDTLMPSARPQVFF